MIKNVTKNTLISQNHDIANKFLDKTLGLLKKESNSCLVIKTRFGIHTIGIKNSIDIIVLDRKNNVVGLRENLSPQRIFIWNPKFDTVIEMPSGSIKKSSTTLGDLLTFE